MSHSSTEQAAGGGSVGHFGARENVAGSLNSKMDVWMGAGVGVPRTAGLQGGVS